MKRLITLAAVAAAAVSVTACATAQDAVGRADNTGPITWTGGSGQLDAALTACRTTAGGDEHARPFAACMQAHGWRRG
jgi:predicted outer membrane protein